MKTNFFADVYEVVMLIPKGRWTSYGAIAHYLGSKGSARMVGWAMSSAQVKPEIPAHRVLNRVGALSGQHHFNPPGQMKRLLENEGIKVVDDKVVNAQKSYWDPSLELM